MISMTADQLATVASQVALKMTASTANTQIASEPATCTTNTAGAAATRPSAASATALAPIGGLRDFPKLSSLKSLTQAWNLWVRGGLGLEAFRLREKNEGSKWRANLSKATWAEYKSFLTTVQARASSMAGARCIIIDADCDEAVAEMDKERLAIGLGVSGYMKLCCYPKKASMGVQMSGDGRLVQASEG